jgi:predicted amidohydrolase YtcJ
MSSPDDVKKITPQPSHFRGEWLVGFGWDQNRWSPADFPTKEVLDQVFPNFPVAFTRADGHAVWMNSKALEKVDYLAKTVGEKPEIEGGAILRDKKGHPTGVFIDLAKIYVDGFIPSSSEEQDNHFLDVALHSLQSRGFTHIRDMSGNEKLWQLLQTRDQKNSLSLYVEENFTCENIKDFDRALKEAVMARKSQTRHLRAYGIKFYFDGALGSQGAFLSQPYVGTDDRGLTLWPLEEVREVIIRTWEKGLDVSVHTIGDEAAHQVMTVAAEVWRLGKVRGRLNIEHGELIRPETLALIKETGTLVHMQPCHWLNDRRFLKEKLGSLYQYAFPWAELQRQGVAMQWGSDTPIEEASVYNNWLALTESPKEGIPALQGHLLSAHSHPDPQWGPECRSTFIDGKVSEIIFDGKRIL